MMVIVSGRWKRDFWAYTNLSNQTNVQLLISKLPPICLNCIIKHPNCTSPVQSYIPWSPCCGILWWGAESIRFPCTARAIWLVSGWLRASSRYAMICTRNCCSWTELKMCFGVPSRNPPGPCEPTHTWVGLLQIFPVLMLPGLSN